MAAFLLALKPPTTITASTATYKTIPSHQETPTVLTIPAINLSAKVVPTGLGVDNLQEVPKQDVGWYKFGPKPGETGNAVLVGHTPGIFSGLTGLNPGDKIEISGLTYQITDKTIYSVNEFPTERFYGPSSDPSLILITCHGLTQRLVVTAKLLPIAY